MKRIFLLFLVLLSIGCVGQKKDIKNEVTIGEQKQEVKIEEQKEEVKMEEWKKDSVLQEQKEEIEWMDKEEEEILKKEYPFLKHSSYNLVYDFPLESKYLTSECRNDGFFDEEDEELYLFKQCHGDTLPFMMVLHEIRTEEETLIPTIFDNQYSVKMNTNNGFILLKIEDYRTSPVDLWNKLVVLDMHTERQTVFTFAPNEDIPNYIRSMVFIPEFQMLAISQDHSISLYKYNDSINFLYDRYVVNGPEYANTLIVKDEKLFYSETKYINLKDLFLN